MVAEDFSFKMQVLAGLQLEKQSQKAPFCSEGNLRQSWILASKAWILDSRYLIPVFVSGTWILDSNP